MRDEADRRRWGLSVACWACRILNLSNLSFLSLYTGKKKYSFSLRGQGQGALLALEASDLEIAPISLKMKMFFFFKLFAVKRGPKCFWSLGPWVVTHSLGQSADACAPFDLTALAHPSSSCSEDASGRERHSETECSGRVVSVLRAVTSRSSKPARRNWRHSPEELALNSVKLQEFCTQALAVPDHAKERQQVWVVPWREAVLSKASWSGFAEICFCVATPSRNPPGCLGKAGVLQDNVRTTGLNVLVKRGADMIYRHKTIRERGDKSRVPCQLIFYCAEAALLNSGRQDGDWLGWWPDVHHIYIFFYIYFRAVGSVRKP